MISVIARKASAMLTQEDADINERVFSFPAERLCAMQDRLDAELIYMLTDEAPGAARQMLGLTSGKKEAASADRRD